VESVDRGPNRQTRLPLALATSLWIDVDHSIASHAYPDVPVIVWTVQRPMRMKSG